ncbi:hypothetical protein AB3S75_023416 [Citrus x aurantiifolia]
MPDSGNPEAKASPNLPWTTRLFMSAVAFAVDVSCRPNMTCNRRLFNLVDLKCSASSQPKNGVKSFDFVIDSENLLKCSASSQPKNTNKVLAPLAMESP